MTISTNEPGPVEFELLNNLIVVNGMINGVDAPMILDTGAGKTIVHRAAASKFGLQLDAKTHTGRGAGGDVEMTAATIDTLAVGGVEQRDLSCMLMDMSGVCEKLEEEVDGIIGTDFLSTLKLTIDYPSREILFIR